MVATIPTIASSMLKTLAVLGDSGGSDIGMQYLGERMVARQSVLLAAFLVQPDRPS
jgi:hypothetical protein